MATQFELQQITKLESLLNAYLDAITSLVASPVEYTLNTGQATQKVVRHDLPKLQEVYGLVWQQYDALLLRTGSGGVVNVCAPQNLPYWSGLNE